MSSSISHHDRFFKASFSSPEAAADLLRLALPSRVIATLDLASLKLAPGSFVDPKLKAHYSDLLFEGATRDSTPILVYLLIEHKSHPERWVSLDLLRYAVEIWRTWLKGAEKGKNLRLPALVPLVLYHGSEEWTVPQNVAELIAAPPALARYRPRFRYELLNLADVADENLPAGVVSRAALLALKYCLRPEIRERVGEILRVLTALEQEPGGLDYIRTLLSYLVIAARDLEAKQLRGAIETSFRIGDEIMPTIAEQWIRKGESVVVERQLRRRFGPLPTWAMERLAGAEPELLEEWAERLLDATSLEGVFRDEVRVI